MVDRVDLSVAQLDGVVVRIGLDADDFTVALHRANANGRFDWEFHVGFIFEAMAT